MDLHSSSSNRKIYGQEREKRYEPRINHTSGFLSFHHIRMRIPKQVAPNPRNTKKSNLHLTYIHEKLMRHRRFVSVFSKPACNIYSLIIDIDRNRFHERKARYNWNLFGKERRANFANSAPKFINT